MFLIIFSSALFLPGWGLEASPVSLGSSSQALLQFSGSANGGGSVRENVGW